MKIDFRNCNFSFDNKPPTQVLTALKANGFRWNGGFRHWHRSRGWVGLPTGFADWIASQCGTSAPAAPAVDPMGVDSAYEDACARTCGL